MAGSKRIAKLAASIQAQASVSERAKAVLAALALGSVLIFTVGFAHSSSVHNAAHDTRHSLSKEEVVEIRQFLAQAGVDPAAYPV